MEEASQRADDLQSELQKVRAGMAEEVIDATLAPNATAIPIAAMPAHSESNGSPGAATHYENVLSRNTIFDTGPDVLSRNAIFDTGAGFPATFPGATHFPEDAPVDFWYNDTSPRARPGPSY